MLPLIPYFGVSVIILITPPSASFPYKEEEAPFIKTEATPGAMIELTEEVLTFELLGDLSKSKQQPYTLEEKKKA